MSSIIVNNQRYPVVPGSSVLDTLLAAGLGISYGCKSGACQACILRASSGEIPDEAQQGLKETLKAEGWFLACRCKPTGDLFIDLSEETQLKQTAYVVKKQPLSSRIMGVWLQPEQPISYRAGQYIVLWRDDSIARSYSLASLPDDEPYLELHVAYIDGGAVSGWVHNELQIGDQVQLQGPMGECFYVPGIPEQPILLVGTGTGLAPIYGVVRDALRNGHTGPIHLFQGARTEDYLYYFDEVSALASKHDNLHYHPSIVQTETLHNAQVENGPIDQLVMHHLPKLNGWRIYLSGAPDIVNRLRKQSFLSGAAIKEIFTDPFG